ncbi:hypothetical protein SJAV_09870 [Sulfurisphaera javensis]|uniref:NIF system FeS cluster assembly NifU N-terminal domain-containing protein n=1 Tax=Sulfurisphaera javensis TaxID=2049879 RepID=A0AAT9GQC4_9CREN
MKDECGCAITRKYASEFLMKRMYNRPKGKEIGDVKIDESRWFKLYFDGEKITYRSSECPIVIITLEALCEAFEEKKNLEEFIRSIKGLTINDIVSKTIKEFREIVYEKSSLYS